jgi:hypothetical protein
MAVETAGLSKSAAVELLEKTSGQLDRTRKAAAARLKSAAGTKTGRAVMAVGAGAGAAVLHRYTSADVAGYKVPWALPLGIAAKYASNDGNMHALGDDLMAAGTALFISENWDAMMAQAGG